MNLFEEVASLVKSILPGNTILDKLPLVLSIVSTAISGGKDKLSPEAALEIQIEIEKLRHGNL